MNYLDCLGNRLKAPGSDPQRLPLIGLAILGAGMSGLMTVAFLGYRGRTLGLSSTDLRGQVSLVNVFASWCTACRDEHPLFMRLKEQGIVPIHGINYKDRPEDAAAWLDELGDPYTRTGADLNGRVSIDWGVYGVPETFLVDRDGYIASKQIGPVTQQVLEETILPLIDKLRQSPRSSGKSFISTQQAEEN